MTLHLSTVTPCLNNYIQRLMQCQAFNDFYLAGGTALALQLGHRKSIDIDLFTNREYGSLDCKSLQHNLTNLFAICENIDCLNNRQMVYTIYVGDTANSLIKLDLCYDEQTIFPIIYEHGIRLASDKEIAAMKLLAVVTGNRPKDFWDIHELLKNYSLSEMITWAIKRNPYTLTETDILKAFNKIWDFPEPEDIISLNNDRWPFIADKLFDEAKRLSI